MDMLKLLFCVVSQLCTIRLERVLVMCTQYKFEGENCIVLCSLPNKSPDVVLTF